MYADSSQKTHKSFFEVELALTTGSPVQLMYNKATTCTLKKTMAAHSCSHVGIAEGYPKLRMMIKSCFEANCR